MTRTTRLLPLVALSLATSLTAAAQAPASSATEQTLFRAPHTNGGYGAPVQRFSSVAGNSVLFSGAEGGWIINHRFVIGAAGFGLATQNVRNAGSALRDSRGRAPVVEIGYGGITLGYVQQPTRLVHLSAQALLGGGGITYDVQGIAGMRAEDAPSDAFFVAEPSVQAEVNVTSVLRFALGGGYRFVSGARLDGLRDADLRGASLSLSLKFGRF